MYQLANFTQANMLKNKNKNKKRNNASLNRNVGQEYCSI